MASLVFFDFEQDVALREPSFYYGTSGSLRHLLHVGDLFRQVQGEFSCHGLHVFLAELFEERRVRVNVTWVLYQLVAYPYESSLRNHELVERVDLREVHFGVPYHFAFGHVRNAF